jgi:hypothetical protein
LKFWKLKKTDSSNVGESSYVNPSPTSLSKFLIQIPYPNSPKLESALSAQTHVDIEVRLPPSSAAVLTLVFCPICQKFESGFLNMMNKANTLPNYPVVSSLATTLDLATFGENLNVPHLMIYDHHWLMNETCLLTSLRGQEPCMIFTAVRISIALSARE